MRGGALAEVAMLGALGLAALAAAIALLGTAAPVDATLAVVVLVAPFG